MKLKIKIGHRKIFKVKKNAQKKLQNLKSTQNNLKNLNWFEIQYCTRVLGIIFRVRLDKNSSTIKIQDTF